MCFECIVTLNSHCLLVHIDPTFTAESVSTVLATVVDMEKLVEALRIPPRKWAKIKQKSSTVDQRRDALINYYVKFSDYASWADLANILYLCGHHQALATAKTLIKIAPGK